jgi:diacylglycerol O-acyltransferase
MRRIPINDAFFLLLESRRTPMHVAGLNLFTLPKDVDAASFLSQLKEVLYHDGPLRRPLGEKLKTGRLGLAGKIFWEEDQEFDFDYHIRHSALPQPGRYRELFSLVSRLHGILLDRSRPLWEMHLIEGLQHRQFATYFKTHHCAIDGVGAMHLMSSMYDTNARSRVKVSPFSQEAYETYKEKLAADKQRGIRPREGEVKAVLEVLGEQLGGAINLGKAIQEMAAIWLGKKSAMAIPFHKVPRSIINTRLSGARRFVAQSWDFERVRAVGKAYDATLNDVVLAMCAGALRKLLKEQHALPKNPLTAMAPVSVRAAGDVDSANAVGGLFVDLATDVGDPERRFRRIKESMDTGKGMLQGMSAREIQIYNAISQAPLLLTQLSGLSDRLPGFSTVISNVPGPRKRLYWNGARLDGMYPVSVLFDGAAINFTLVSNVDKLDFGIVACRRSVPHVQRLIDYMEESLVELEHAAGLGKPPGRKAPASGKTRNT